LVANKQVSFGCTVLDAQEIRVGEVVGNSSLVESRILHMHAPLQAVIATYGKKIEERADSW